MVGGVGTRGALLFAAARRGCGGDRRVDVSRGRLAGALTSGRRARDRRRGRLPPTPPPGDGSVPRTPSKAGWVWRCLVGLGWRREGVCRRGVMVLGVAGFWSGRAERPGAWAREGGSGCGLMALAGLCFLAAARPGVGIAWWSFEGVAGWCANERASCSRSSSGALAPDTPAGGRSRPPDPLQSRVGSSVVAGPRWRRERGWLGWCDGAGCGWLLVRPRGAAGRVGVEVGRDWGVLALAGAPLLAAARRGGDRLVEFRGGGWLLCWREGDRGAFVRRGRSEVGISLRSWPPTPPPGDASDVGIALLARGPPDPLQAGWPRRCRTGLGGGGRGGVGVV